MWSIIIGCDNGAVRLVGGGNEQEGVVEVCVDNIWGLIGETGWDIEDATVVCHQLGYNSKFSKSLVTIHILYFNIPFISMHIISLLSISSFDNLYFPYSFNQQFTFSNIKKTCFYRQCSLCWTRGHIDWLY